MKNKSFILDEIDNLPNPFNSLLFQNALYSKSIDELKIWIELTDEIFINELIELLYENNVDSFKIPIIIDILIYSKYQMDYSLECGYKTDERKNNNYRVKNNEINKNRPLVEPIEIENLVVKLTELLNIERELRIELLQLIIYREDLPRFERKVKVKVKNIENYLIKNI